MSKSKHSTPSSRRTKGKRISLGVRLLLEAAEAEYRANQTRSYTLLDAIDEHQQAGLLGPVGQVLFEEVVNTHLLDWLDKPIVEIGKTDILARWSAMAIKGHYDAGRWFLQVIQTLRKFAAFRHPELPWGQDPFEELNLFLSPMPKKEQ
jgi:hypothetical protein